MNQSLKKFVVVLVSLLLMAGCVQRPDDSGKKKKAVKVSDKNVDLNKLAKNVKVATERYKAPVDGPYKGEKDALITIVEYSDFQCPFCSRVNPTMKKIMNEYAGKVKIVWKNNPLGFHKNAMPAAEASYTIWKLKGNEAFWKAHDKFFSNQRALTPDFLKATAKELGVDMTKFEEMTSKHVHQEAIKKDQAYGNKLGARGTPAFFINGVFLSGAQPYPNFKKLIDQELAYANKLVKEGTAVKDVYSKITKNALDKAKPKPRPQRNARPGQPDPNKYYYNSIENSPWKGEKDALVTIVEYSDFQCPFCSRVNPTMKKIMDNYAGKVKIVWKNNPLGFHKDAMPAAEASYAIWKLKGNEAFWKAHDKFFSNQRGLKADFLKATAKELGVDMAKFEEMTSKHVNQPFIRKSQVEGAKVGARGTPAFFINGRFISGAQPYDNFKRVIDQELKKAQELEKKVGKGKVYETIMKSSLKEVKSAPAARRRPGQPDPNKYYYNSIENSPYKGEKDALVTIVEYSDFQCPFCSRVNPTMKKIMDNYAGKVKVVWKNNPLGFHKDAMPAAEASYAIWKLKGNEAFWKAHDKFFSNQRGLKSDFFNATAKELGVDMAKFEEMTSKHVNQPFIRKSQVEGAKVGARGTPAFFINGKFLSGAQPYDNFKKIIDEELKKAEAMEKKVGKGKVYETIMKSALKEVAKAPAAARRPGQPDPNKYYYNSIENSPWKGAKDAYITIVEYSDFQCPFCSRVNPTMKKIMDDYAGKVKVVWKNNPLGFHKDAMPAAEASYAIWKLKGNSAFWAAHDKFFSNQRGLKADFLKATAKELGVDMAKFEEMTSKHVNQPFIKKGQIEGAKVGARGTPAFFINGRFLSGAQPYPNFKKIIDEELKKAEAMEKKVGKAKIYETIMKTALKKVN